MQILLMLLLLVLCASCSNGVNSDSATEGVEANLDQDGGSAEAPATFRDQVALGETEYAEYCAKCHGDMGQGTYGGPNLVGDDALPLDPPVNRAVRTEQFVTVGDVVNFAMMNMPADAPGTLSEEQYLAIVAFDLSANGITLDQKLTLELADTLTIPR